MDTCHMATRMRLLGKGNELFARGIPATKMYFVRRLSEHQARAALAFQAQTCDGFAEVREEAVFDDQRPVLNRQYFKTALIHEGLWFCEMALWLESDTVHGAEQPLLHTGRAKAEHSCDVAELDAPRLRDIAKRHPNVIGDLSKYAAHFAEGIKDYGDIPELWGTEGECHDLVKHVYPVPQPATPGSSAPLSILSLFSLRAT
mmetsp:Transcript_109987/g.306511  ORF Transcript_109987/g.306511 Transcript_109987/m.306511 type:complete len:202 (+) Transcript_109987:2-607(+)